MFTVSTYTDTRVGKKTPRNQQVKLRKTNPFTLLEYARLVGTRYKGVPRGVPVTIGYSDNSESETRARRG